MPGPIKVFVYADDPISQIGVASQLGSRADIAVIEDIDDAVVAVLVADDVDEQLLGVVAAIQRDGCPRVVMVVTRLDENALLQAVETGVAAVLRRNEAETDRLVEAVRAAAAGDGSVPADLLGRLLGRVGHLQRTVLAPRGLMLSGLTARETEVLRLIADGCDTAEIADRLCYSERTVKNVLHDVTSRLGLRNRSHAVAYAVREGLI
ncbi:MAG TPA: response regulator transcription factor [Acidimicrobiales bacterium]|nr:response regulator transcription factor [Acidimicrobiales bacterium]